MNFVIDLAHRGVSATQWLEHRSAESEGLRFDFSWILRKFCPTLVTRRKKHNSLLILGCNGLISCESKLETDE